MQGRYKMIAVLMMFLLVGAVFTAGCLDEEEGAQSSPKSTFKEFMKEADDKDGEKALEYTDAELLKDNDSLTDDIDEAESYIDDGNMTYSDYEIKEVVYKEDMEETNKSWMEKTENWYEESNGISVKDSCFLKVDIDGDNQLDTVPLIKVDGKWYITLIFMMPQEGGASTHQSGDFASYDQMISENECEIPFAKFSPERSISELQFRLETPDEGSDIDTFSSDADGAVAEFSSLPSYQLNYTDVVENELINSGDNVIVYNSDGLPSGNYELAVLYNGNEIDSLSWMI